MPESLAAYVANAVIDRHYLHDFLRCTIDDDAFKHAINLLLYVPESARSINGFDAWPSSNSVTLNLRCPVILAF